MFSTMISLPSLLLPEYRIVSRVPRRRGNGERAEIGIGALVVLSVTLRMAFWASHTKGGSHVPAGFAVKAPWVRMIRKRV